MVSLLNAVTAHCKLSVLYYFVHIICSFAHALDFVSAEFSGVICWYVIDENLPNIKEFFETLIYFMGIYKVILT